MKLQSINKYISTKTSNESYKCVEQTDVQAALCVVKPSALISARDPSASETSAQLLLFSLMNKAT